MACPICKKETQAAHRPFCSQRCADIDLGNWMTGAYAVPSNDPEDAEKLADELEDAARNGTGKLH